jgi:hypothetical protein
LIVKIRFSTNQYTVPEGFVTKMIGARTLLSACVACAEYERSFGGGTADADRSVRAPFPPVAIGSGDLFYVFVGKIAVSAVYQKAVIAGVDE